MIRLFSAMPKAIVTRGLLKAILYSFGAWAVAWLITWLASMEASQTLGEYGWVIPALNTLAVFFKQYFDAYKK